MSAWPAREIHLHTIWPSRLKNYLSGDYFRQWALYFLQLKLPSAEFVVDGWGFSACCLSPWLDPHSSTARLRHAMQDCAIIHLIICDCHHCRACHQLGICNLLLKPLIHSLPTTIQPLSFLFVKIFWCCDSFVSKSFSSVTYRWPCGEELKFKNNLAPW